MSDSFRSFASSMLCVIVLSILFLICLSACTVSSKEEVDSQNSFQIEPVDLNQFFEDEGKIFGYQELKVKLQIYVLISFPIFYLVYAVKAY